MIKLSIYTNKNLTAFLCVAPFHNAYHKTGPVKWTVYFPSVFLSPDPSKRYTHGTIAEGGKKLMRVLKWSRNFKKLEYDKRGGLDREHNGVNVAWGEDGKIWIIWKSVVTTIRGNELSVTESDDDAQWMQLQWGSRRMRVCWKLSALPSLAPFLTTSMRNHIKFPSGIFDEMLLARNEEFQNLT